MLALWCTFLLSSMPRAQLPYKHYTTRDGLPHDLIFRMCQDQKGYMWFGTDAGLAKFNGEEFQVFTMSEGLRSSFVIDVIPYGTDSLAVGTWGGGLHWVSQDSVLPSGLPEEENSKLHYLFVLDNDVYGYGTVSRDLRRYSKEASGIWKKKDLDSIVEGYLKRAQEINGKIFLFAGRFISKPTTGIWEYIPGNMAKPVFPFLSGKEIHDFGPYNEETYYATFADTLAIFNDSRVLEFKTTPFKKGLLHSYEKDKFREVFILLRNDTRIHEIFIYDKRSGVWTNFSEQADIRALVSEVLIDRDHTIWITTNADGIYQLPLSDQKAFTSVWEGDNILDVAQSDQGDIFFISMHNLYEWERSKARVTLCERKDLKYLRQFVKDEVTTKEFFIFRQSSTETRFEFLGYEVVVGDIPLESDPSGIKYLPTRGLSIGTGTMFGKDSSSYKPLKIDLPGDISDIAGIRDTYWVATRNGPLLLDNTTYEVRELPVSLSPLRDSFIGDLCTVGDAMWIATHQGIYQYTQKGVLKRYTAQDELMCDQVNALLVDHRGSLWLATQCGVSVFTGEEFLHYGVEQGLPFASANTLFEDDSHKIWVAGSNGLAYLDNRNPPIPAPSPSLDIRQEEAFFKLGVINLSGTGKRLQYRLNETQWSEVQVGKLDLSNQRPGNYTILFRVRSPNSPWVYSPPYPFSIPTPWYQNWAYLTPMSLAAFGLLLFWIRVVTKRNQRLRNTLWQRDRLQHQLAEVRENMAMDFHDELGNKLAGIAAMSQTLLQDETQDAQSARALQQIERHSNALYDGVRDFIWSIDSKSDRLEELVTHLTDFGEGLFQDAPVTFYVHTRGIEANMDLPNYWGRQLLLIFKEAMTNALRHAQAARVILSIRMEKDVLRMVLEDDGIGFDIEQGHRTSGLLHMQRRAKKIASRVRVESCKGEGTSIIFIGSVLLQAKSRVPIPPNTFKGTSKN